MEIPRPSLDCNTAKGQVYIGKQLLCHDRLEAALKCEIIATDTTSASDIDALIVKNKKLVAIAEIKSREMKLKNSDDRSQRRLIYMGRDYDSYLITYEKLEKLKTICQMFCVPGFLFVTLIESDQTVFWKICDGAGNFVAEFEKKRTQTQATCNGGLAYRENAYISLNSMKILIKS